MTQPSQPSVDVTAAKAVVAGIGATITALLGALTVVSVAVNDGQLDGGEIGGLITTAITLITTVYGVWKVPNQPVRNNTSFVSGR